MDIGYWLTKQSACWVLTDEDWQVWALADTVTILSGVGLDWEIDPWGSRIHNHDPEEVLEQSGAQ